MNLDIAGIENQPTSKSRALLFSLGITGVILSVFFLLLELAKLKEQPQEGAEIVQATIASILACGLSLWLLAALVKFFSKGESRLAFIRINASQLDLFKKYSAIYLMVFIATELLLRSTDLGQLVQEPEISSAPIPLWGFFLTIFLVTIAGPIFEEALFRGFLFARLRRAFKFWPAFLVSGLIFSLLHFNFQGSAAHNTFIILDILIFSYFVTKLFEASGNLWPSIFLHGFSNFVIFILLSVSNLLESITVI